MKKLFLGLMILATSSFFIACSDDDDKDQMISYSEVPEVAQKFMEEHFIGFSEADVLSVKLEDNGTYDVKFKNKIEIDFYPNGVWKDIDLNGNSLPSSIAMLLPENALSYVSSTYPNAVIEEIEKIGAYSENGQGFKIELIDDREIYFDAAGNVLKDKGNEDGGKQTVSFDKLPSKTQEFLNTYFKGEIPSSIEKEWNKYEVKYNDEKPNEVEVEFFSNDGSFKSVEAESANEIIRSIIKGVSGSTAILDYLDKNHSAGVIEEFSVAATGITVDKGYVVEIDGKPDYKIYFNEKGEHVKTVRD